MEIENFDTLAKALEKLTSEKIIIIPREPDNKFNKDREFECSGFIIVEEKVYENHLEGLEYRIMLEPIHDVYVSRNPQKIYDVIKVLGE